MDINNIKDNFRATLDNLLAIWVPLTGTGTDHLTGTVKYLVLKTFAQYSIKPPRDSKIPVLEHLFRGQKGKSG